MAKAPARGCYGASASNPVSHCLFALPYTHRKIPGAGGSELFGSGSGAVHYADAEGSGASASQSWYFEHRCAELSAFGLSSIMM